VQVDVLLGKTALDGRHELAGHGHQRALGERPHVADRHCALEREHQIAVVLFGSQRGRRSNRLAHVVSGELVGEDLSL
jgi:hypothetical protein